MEDGDYERASNSEQDSNDSRAEDSYDESSEDEKENEADKKKKTEDGEEEEDPDQIAENENDDTILTRSERQSHRNVELEKPLPGQPDLRKSLRSVTPYERARLIAARAKMIAMDDPPVHPNYADADTDDPLTLAEMEFDDPTIEFCIDIGRPYDQPLRGSITEWFEKTELLLPTQLETLGLPPQPFDPWTVRGQLAILSQLK